MRGAHFLGILGCSFAVSLLSFRLMTPPAEISPRFQSAVELHRDLKTGMAYVVEVRSGEARLNLDFSAGKQYDLILSSLAEAGEVSLVHLKSVQPKKADSSKIRPLPTHPELPNELRARAHPVPKNSVPLRNHQGLPSQSTAKSRRTFFIHVTNGSLDDPKQYARIQAWLLKSGKQVQIYLDSQQRASELHPHLAEEIIRLMEEAIIPTTKHCLGTFRDIDDDGKFTVLLSPWLNHLQGGRVSLGGFVRGTDFRKNCPPPFGNQCDMLYLNSNVKPGGNLRALLAHEFAHAVSFSRRLPSMKFPAGCPDEEDWLNEAIAHLSENLNHTGWSNLAHRISRFLDAPEAFPLVVPDYYSAGLWRNHGCRGATYLFLRWCVDQFGPEILARLVQNHATGRQNLEDITGVAFPELFRRWSISLISKHEAPSRAGRNLPAVDLHGTLENWVLAGPRIHRWHVSDKKPPTIRLRGTSSAFLRIDNSHPDANASRRQIVIRANSAAKIQVTVIPRSTPKFSDTEPLLPGKIWWERSGKPDNPWDEFECVEDAHHPMALCIQFPIHKPTVESSPAKTRQTYQPECIALEQHGVSASFSKRIDLTPEDRETGFVRIPISAGNRAAHDHAGLKIRFRNGNGRRFTKRVEVPLPNFDVNCRLSWYP